MYVNAESSNKPHAAFGVNHGRLVEIKNIYDPTNFFNHNLNIKPTVSAG